MQRSSQLSKKFPLYYLIGTAVIVLIYALTQIPKSLSLAEFQKVDQSSAASVTTKITKEYVASQAFNQDGAKADTAENNWIGNSSSVDSSYLGLRFTGVTLPAGAELVSAQVAYTLPSESWINVSANIYGEKSSNPTAFTRSSLPSSRSRTVASASFTSNQKLLANTAYNLPEIKNVVAEILPAGSTQDVNLLVKGAGQRWGRFTIQSNPKLVLVYNVTTGSNPEPSASSVVVTAAPVPTTNATPTMTMKPAATQTPVPTTISGGGTQSAPVGTVSMAFAKWTPSKWDTCTKEQHDAYSVIGPDGKRYPTWHPPLGPGGCKFGHEHGRNPVGYQYWNEVKKNFAYDANKDGQISDAELALAGIPFGYVNEQLDSANLGMMRHESHEGHKIEFANGEGDIGTGTDPFDSSKTGGVVVPQNGTGGRKFDPTGVRCYHFHKIHQGVSSPDALTNNIHETIMHTKCDSTRADYPSSTTLLSGMIAFGAAGEFTRFCPDNRTEIVSLGKNASNANFPGTRGNGTRNIITRDCVENTVLVPEGQFSGFPYEEWDGQFFVTRPNGQAIASNGGAWDVHDAIRYYNPASANKQSYSADLCYEIFGNRKTRGGTCEWMTNYGSIKGITWDDPRSAYKGVHRGQYVNSSRIFNAGGPQYWYTDVFGRNAQTTPFPGSVRQMVSPVNADLIGKVAIQPRIIQREHDDGNNSVHAPN